MFLFFQEFFYDLLIRDSGKGEERSKVDKKKLHKKLIEKCMERKYKSYKINELKNNSLSINWKENQGSKKYFELINARYKCIKNKTL